MSAPTSPPESLAQLDQLEKQIISAIQSAASAVTELARDKPSVKQVEAHTNSFIKTLEDVEGNLSRQINYLTKVATNQPHEGSNYAAQKDFQMADHRFEHVRSRLIELDRLKLAHKAAAAATLQSHGMENAMDTSGGVAPPSGQSGGGVGGAVGAGSAAQQGQLQRALTSDSPHT